MPTINKRMPKRKRDLSKITGQQIDNLIKGHSISITPVFESDQERKDVWNTHKSMLMSLQGKPHIKGIGDFWTGIEYFNYGERPHAWWSYDALELRRIVEGNPKGVSPEHGYSFGMCKAYGGDIDWLNEYPVYESQFEYLKRLNLLLPGEEKRVLKQG